MNDSRSRSVSAAATLAIALAGGILSPDASAQLRPPPSSSPPEAVIALHGARQGSAAAAPATEGHRPPPRWSDDLRVKNALVIGGGILLVGAYGAAKWWDEGFTGDFRTQNEGWFGRNTAYGGADKVGHAFSAYVGMRVVTRAFEAIGNEPAAARTLAAWATLGVMTGIEVLDGYSKQYRFSGEDAIMNVVGVGLGYLMERNRELDNLLDFRLLYRKSDYSNWDPAGDYSGQTYLLAAKASAIPGLREHGLLRYVEFAAGYGTRGYQDPPGVERRRNLYFGVSLNLSEVLAQTVFRGSTTRSTSQRAADTFLEFVQVPGTAALASHGL